MPRIAEKLEFIKIRAVKVCTKAMTGSSPGHNNPGFLVNSRKNCLRKEKSCYFKMNFVRLLVLYGEKYAFKPCKWEISAYIVSSKNLNKVHNPLV